MEKETKNVIKLYAGLMVVTTLFWCRLLTIFMDVNVGLAFVYSWWVLAPVTIFALLVTFVVSKR